MADCTNINEHGEYCHRPTFEGSPLSLCKLHLILAAQFVAEMGGLGAQHILMPEPAPKPSRAVIKLGRPQVVYYMINQNRIKIGTSTNLPQRARDIPNDKILAAEPGRNAQENLRHRQFASLRLKGEWFEYAPALKEHVATIRSQFGDPLTLWAQMVAEFDMPTRR